MYFVDDKVGISAYLSTRFNEPCSPIRDVISVHNCISMLHNFAISYGVAKNRRLTSIQDTDSSFSDKYLNKEPRNILTGFEKHLKKVVCFLY